VHRCGDEAAWWQKTGIDPVAFARALWLESHPLPAADAIADRSPRPYRGSGRRRSNCKTNPIAQVRSQ
jgi:hypothetical protein